MGHASYRSFEGGFNILCAHPLSFYVYAYRPMYVTYILLLFLARDAFVRTNRCTTAMMFAPPPLCPSVWNGGAL